MVRSWHDDTIERIRPRYIDDLGNERPVYDNTPVTITQCRVTPVSATELNDRRAGAEVTHLLSAPIDADIRMGDRVQFDGRSFDVRLPPERHRGPRGRVAHLNADLRESIG